MHTAILSYPPAGASVTLSVQIDGTAVTTSTATIPAGTAAYVQNITCVTCYTTTGVVTILAQYTGDPSSFVDLTHDTGFAITSLSATGLFPTIPATITAQFTGLTAGETYTLTLWCTANQKVQTTQVAPGATGTITYQALPGICGVKRYLTIASLDEAHIAVGST